MAAEPAKPLLEPVTRGLAKSLPELARRGEVRS
jgi:hypothetical protein